MPETRNILEAAALIDDRNAALAMVAGALGISDLTTANRIVTFDWRWARFDKAGRLGELASWLRAECFEAMDLVSAPTPMQTVGTND